MLTKQEAAAQLGISVSTIDRLALRGEIAYYKIGSSKKFRQEDIEAYLNRARVVALPRQSREPVSPAPAPAAEKRGPGRPRRTEIKQYYSGMKVV